MIVLDRKSISVSNGLIRTLNVDGDVLSLVGGEESELSTEGTEMEASDLLVEFLGESGELVGIGWDGDADVLNAFFFEPRVRAVPEFGAFPEFVVDGGWGFAEEALFG